MNYFLTAVRRKGRWCSRIKHPHVAAVIAQTGGGAVEIAAQLTGVQLNRNEPPRAA